jgi:hypothetical protein
MLMVLLVHVDGVLVPQLIAVVKVNDCGPVPCGGAIPGVMLTVNCQVVFPGTITPESARRIAKLPDAPVPGVVGHPRPTGEVCVVKPPPFNVGDAPPAVMSCALIVPQAHTRPSGPVTVPVTVVKPPCANRDGTAKQRSKNKKKDRRIVVLSVCLPHDGRAYGAKNP